MHVCMYMSATCANERGVARVTSMSAPYHLAKERGDGRGKDR
jgi:hypothetical protein